MFLELSIMQLLQNFLEHSFFWLFAIWFIWVAAIFVIRHYRHKRTGIVFPPVPPERIRFDEKRASGRSCKSWFTKHGGASRCLQVTVTDTEVWVRTNFPFTALAQQCDLEHRIPKAAITNVQPKQSAFVQTVLLEYRDERGQSHQLSLNLQKPDDFLKALAN